MAVIIFLAFTYKFLMANVSYIKSQKLSGQEVVHKKKSAETEYLNLFSDEARAKLKVYNNYVTKSKHAYLSCRYSNNYEIILHKVNLDKSVITGEILSMKKGNVRNSSDAIYAGYESGNFRFNYSFEYDSIINKITLLYDEKGQVLEKTNLGDSVINVLTDASKIAISYDLDDTNDMVFSTVKSYNFKGNLKMNFSLYKKKNNLYIILIYSDQNDFTVDLNTFKYLFLGINP